MKKNKRKVLIFTDHRKHSSENSLYDLTIKCLEHPATETVSIATKGNALNLDFFNCVIDSNLWATTVDRSFSFSTDDHPLSKNFIQIKFQEYDLVWLRMPPPLTSKFLEYLDKVFFNSVIINDPKSIELTGSKKFLLNFPKLCPPMKLCSSVSDIDAFRSLFPIVLKPLNEYGGRGILKIDRGVVYSDTDSWTFEEFAMGFKQNPIDYLAVKYLKNVRKGDKRIVVVNGEILGASLRLPAENSWLCNVSMGGSSSIAEIDQEEKEIIKEINPYLSQRGIVMYGVDTLVDDTGQRVLSEINTASIGGLPQIAKLRNEPLVEKAIELIWKYYFDKIL